MVPQHPFWGDCRESPTLSLNIFLTNPWQAQSCSVSGHSCRETCLGHRKDRSGEVRWCSGRGDIAWASRARRRWLLPKPWPDQESWSGSCGITSSLLIEVHMFTACQPPPACVKLLHLWLCSLLAFSSFWCCTGKVSLCPYFSTCTLMRTVCSF